MKLSALFLLLSLISSATFAHPGDRPDREERRKARIERRANRVTHKWDERSGLQKRRDFKIILFMALGAGLLVKNVSGE